MQINIRNLCQNYGKQTVLNKVNLTFSNGIMGLLGPNGAGKTTLMRILATLQRATSGEVTFGDLKLGRNDPLIRRQIGYLPQHFGLYERLTGEEFLEYIAVLKGIHVSKERKRQIEAVLEDVNLLPQRKKAIRSYSGGMRQRIGIAQALLGDPKVIIVDEPTVGLDPEERIRFRNMLSERSLQRTVLLSTHIVSDIETSCTELAVLHTGNLLYHGTTNELLERISGKVWQTVISREQWQGERERMAVISQRTVPAGYELRVISAETPPGEASAAEPKLEDAYMALIGGHRLA